MPLQPVKARQQSPAAKQAVRPHSPAEKPAARQSPEKRAHRAAQGPVKKDLRKARLKKAPLERAQKSSLSFPQMEKNQSFLPAGLNHSFPPVEMSL
ncbi:MAG: hypothetical protein LUD50_08320 [Clostridia bacterium]|nr:hypothetical protein [Clostridia bacterium]